MMFKRNHKQAYSSKSLSPRQLKTEHLESRLMLAGDVIYRVNTGGGLIAAIDGGPDWVANTGLTFSNATGSATGTVNNSNTFGGVFNSTTPQVPSSTPNGIFLTERFLGGGQGATLGFDLPVDPGEYEVRLYFSEGFNGITAAGQRQFDVQIENQLVLDNYDPFAVTGGVGIGTFETFTVTSDGNLDIDLSRGVENPAIRGIEVISLADTPNELQADTASIDFGEVLVGNSVVEQVVLTNAGDTGDPSITIDPATASIRNIDFDLTFSQAGVITLAPGESTVVNVTYTPSSANVDNTTLEILSSSDNNPLLISLSGEGVSSFSVGFTTSQLQGAQGLFSGTTLGFGPDGRLYVGQGFGLIQAFEIERTGPNDFNVISEETITVINDIVNHEDNGTPNTEGTRIIGGLEFAGTAEDPIIFVASSDPRTNENESIDTNSGIISRLTRNAQGVWERLDLVRGIPRSGRDHINGGLQLITDSTGNPTTLLHSVGSFTNRGAPSGPFGNVPEFALSAAILSIDLVAIGDTTYDIPTLDDPTRPNIVQIQRDGNGVPIPDVNGNAIPILINGQTVDELDEFGTAIDRAIAPNGSLVPLIEDAVIQGQGIGDIFGGNGGLNQARLVPNSPVQVFASGLRNSFDLLITEAGEVYATDNGPNSGFGNNVEVVNGLPTNGTGGPPGPTAQDQLHFISEPGRDFFGHTNPTRANSQNTFGGQSPVAGTLNGVPFDLSNPVGAEFPFVEPASPADGAVTTFNGSTNGIVEFTPNNFGGELQGDILTITLNGTVTRISHDPISGAPADVSVLATIQAPGRELDITVAETGPFAGTIFVATVDNGTITILEPTDLDAGGGDPVDPNDLDGDGFTNDDEIANGTDPNNPASLPPDNDGDFISDLTDTDDDNDSILDLNDPFAIDALNGQDTTVGTFFSFDNFVEAQGGILGLGFTGTQINGSLDFLDSVDPAAVTAIGAAGVFTVDSALAGTSRGAANDQLQALQFGVNVAQETEEFTARTRLLTPFSDITTVTAGQEQGLYIGTGDQDNYLSIIVTGDNGGSIQVIREVNGVDTIEATTPLSLPSAEDIELFLTVDPLTSTVQAAFQLDGQPGLTLLGSPIAIPEEWLTDAALAVGITSSNPQNVDQTPGGPEDFSVTYDFLGVTREVDDRGASALVTVDPGNNIQGSSIFVDDSFVINNTSSNGQQITSVTIDLSTAILPDLLFDANGGAGDPTGRNFTQTSEVGNTQQTTNSFGGARDGGFETLTINFDGFAPNEAFGFAVDVDPTTIQGDGGSPANAGEISGFEISGATITVNFDDGTSTVSQLSPEPGSEVASSSDTRSGALAAPGLEVLGIGAQPNVVAPDTQTVRLTAPEGATVIFQHAEAALFTGAGGFDIDPFEGNRILSIDEQTFTIGVAGFVDVPVTLLNTLPEGGLNYFLATVEDANGRRSDLSQALVQALPDAPANVIEEVFNINFLANAGPAGSQNATLNGTPFSANVTPVAFNGTTFNDIGPNSQAVATTNGQLQNLTDSEGNASAVDVSLTVNSGTFDFSSNQTSIGLLQNYFTINDGFNPNATDPAPATISLSDLGAGTIWDIYLISQGDQVGQGGTFTIDGETRTSTGANPGASTFVEGENFVVFSDITADASGNISVTFDDFRPVGGGATNFGILNGIQLVRRASAPNSLPGDFDASGTVDGADLDVFEGSFSSTTNLAADGVQDGAINGADFLLWQLNFGSTQSSAVAAASTASSVQVAALEAPEVMTIPFAPAAETQQAVDQAFSEVILSLDGDFLSATTSEIEVDEVEVAAEAVGEASQNASLLPVSEKASEDTKPSGSEVAEEEDGSQADELSDSLLDELFATLGA